MQALSWLHYSLSVIVATLAVSLAARADNLNVTLRHRVETAEGSGRYHTLTREESWQPEQTAIIVCDMWDLHHCLNAVRREGELAPRLEQVLNTAREAGVTIIHAPSSCMEFYEGNPARERAKAAPQADNLPEDIGQWCHKIPAEEQGTYPIDQSDGGEDDDPDEHAEWEAKLEAMGRNPGAPWKRQIDVLTIDQDRDFITDRGEETWNILESRGIDNVILTGVHTNMCVLGRPFGLRQLAQNGKHVVLMRDLTDTMYNPQAWPFVSHFTGTDLIIEHIEKFVCPTITSDQLIGGEAFVFQNDNRPHVVMLIGEDEYRTNETLPPFAVEQLGKEYQLSIVHADDDNPNHFPGIEIIKEADVLLVSVRRRTLPKEQLDHVRQHVAAGKPVIGLRTASHAFTLRREHPPEGLSAWPEFDAQVFGGNYSNHHGNKLVATISVIEKNADHAILEGMSREEFKSNGSLYVVSPLAEGTRPLLMGRVEGHDPEPVAWTFERAGGGQSFYTSLGHPDDFETPAFVRMLKNAVDWAAEGTAKKSLTKVSLNDAERGWVPVSLPIETPDEDGIRASSIADDPTTRDIEQRPRSLNERLGATDEPTRAAVLAAPVWYRCYVAIPQERINDSGFHVEFPNYWRGCSVWLNGHKVKNCDYMFNASPDMVEAGLNTLVVRLTTIEGREAFTRKGVTALVLDFDAPHPPDKPWAEFRIPLHGTWQHRIGDDDSFAQLTLPAQYAASPDAVFVLD
jgi:type 1 glutamine amidotransferase/nicotinamidase-related amidase